MKPNDKVYDNILFSITTLYIHHPEIDQNTPISFVKGDIENFDQHLFLGDSVVSYFLRWMSLQSNKISIIDSISMTMNKLKDDKTTKVEKTFLHFF